MKYYTYHWRGKEIPGSFKEIDPVTGKELLYLEVADEDLPRLALKYDVMLRTIQEESTKKNPNPSKPPIFCIYLDDRGKRFRQM